MFWTGFSTGEVGRRGLIIPESPRTHSTLYNICMLLIVVVPCFSSRQSRSNGAKLLQCVQRDKNTAAKMCRVVLIATRRVDCSCKYLRYSILILDDTLVDNRMKTNKAYGILYRRHYCHGENGKTADDKRQPPRAS